jgi:hypothetical protein
MAKFVFLNELASNLFRGFVYFHQLTGGADLQNRHNKRVAAKIVFLNELAPEGVYIPRGFACF